MKRRKSLCELCQHKVVIQFHSDTIDNAISKQECFYNFMVTVESNEHLYRTHVGNVIVDECSSYNESVKIKYEKL